MAEDVDSLNLVFFTQRWWTCKDDRLLVAKMHGYLRFIEQTVCGVAPGDYLRGEDVA